LCIPVPRVTIQEPQATEFDEVNIYFPITRNRVFALKTFSFFNLIQDKDANAKLPTQNIGKNIGKSSEVLICFPIDIVISRLCVIEIRRYVILRLPYPMQTQVEIKEVIRDKGDDANKVRFNVYLDYA